MLKKKKKTEPLHGRGVISTIICAAKERNGPASVNKNYSTDSPDSHYAHGVFATLTLFDGWNLITCGQSCIMSTHVSHHYLTQCIKFSRSYTNGSCSFLFCGKSIFCAKSVVHLGLVTWQIIMTFLDGLVISVSKQMVFWVFCDPIVQTRLLYTVEPLYKGHHWGPTFCPL